MDSIPSNGTIYTFKRVNASLVKDMTGTNSGLSVYPNPADNELTIETPIAAASLCLYDLTGKKIAAISTSKKITTFSTERIAAGLYFLQVRTGEGTQVKKIWITH